MKDCAEIEKLLYPYIDGELDVTQNLDVEAHLLRCQKCCDLLNEEKRFLSLVKNGCRQEEGPPALKAKIERMLQKKQRPFVRRLSRHPFKTAFAAALAGIFLFLLIGELLDLSLNRTPPFVRASLENHLKYINGNLPLEIESHDPQAVMAWFKKRIDFMPHLPDLKDDTIVLLGGRMAKFEGQNVALVSYRIEKSPVTMCVIRGNPTAYVESKDFTFLQGRRFNFSHRSGLNAVSWTDQGNNFALISSHPKQNIMSCKVCHGRGSGLLDFNALLGIRS
jgi:mycothiol system anti-sigma-R factor